MPPIPLFEAIPVVSTADPQVVSRLAEALARPPGTRLIHVGSDQLHGRTILTAIGEGPALVDALAELGRRAAAAIDLRIQAGLHPRVGALDLAPLVALGPHARPGDAVPFAQQLARRLADEAGIPCVHYNLADLDGRQLPDIRSGGLEALLARIARGEVPARLPAGGLPEDALRTGVTCVGARTLLVGFNVELDVEDPALARQIALELSKPDGGLPALRALGLARGAGRSQVAMSLLDCRQTSVLEAFSAVERLAREGGARAVRSELLGCAAAGAWPEGLAGRIREPDMAAAGAERRILETWLPGGALATDPGLLRPLGAEQSAPADRLPLHAGGDPRLRLLDLTLDEQQAALRTAVVELGEKPYRAAQTLRAIWQGRRRDFGLMTDLPPALRGQLRGRVRLPLLEMSHRAASVDGTVKYLWRLADGPEVESVAIPSESRLTFCVSSQAGCSLHCTFCATASLGLARNLTAGEIADQCLAMLSDWREDGREEPPALNVVFMGMGEPGHNIQAVLAACRMLNSPDGLGIGARHLTVSTSGVVPAIRELAREPMQVRLAVSLHSPTQEGRAALMDVAERHPLPELLAACQAYHDATRRRITWEYAVLPGINDRLADARGLAALAARIPSKINLIPYNPVAGFDAPAATDEVARRFREAVVARFDGDVMVRRTRGRDIEAACGMLHRARAGATG